MASLASADGADDTTSRRAGLVLDPQYMSRHTEEGFDNYVVDPRGDPTGLQTLDSQSTGYSVSSNKRIELRPELTAPVAKSYKTDIEALESIRPTKLDSSQQLKVVLERIIRELDTFSNEGDASGPSGRTIASVVAECISHLMPMGSSDSSESLPLRQAATSYQGIEWLKTLTAGLMTSSERFDAISTQENGFPMFDPFGRPIMNRLAYVTNHKLKEKSIRVAMNPHTGEFDSTVERMFGAQLAASRMLLPPNEVVYTVSKTSGGSAGILKSLEQLARSAPGFSEETPVYVFVRYDVGSNVGKGGNDVFVPHLVHVVGNINKRALREEERMDEGVDGRGDPKKPRANPVALPRNPKKRDLSTRTVVAADLSVLGRRWQGSLQDAPAAVGEVNEQYALGSHGSQLSNLPSVGQQTRFSENVDPYTVYDFRSQLYIDKTNPTPPRFLEGIHLKEVNDEATSNDRPIHAVYTGLQSLGGAKEFDWGDNKPPEWFTQQQQEQQRLGLPQNVYVDPRIVANSWRDFGTSDSDDSSFTWCTSAYVSLYPASDVLNATSQVKARLKAFVEQHPTFASFKDVLSVSMGEPSVRAFCFHDEYTDGEEKYVLPGLRESSTSDETNAFLFEKPLWRNSKSWLKDASTVMDNDISDGRSAVQSFAERLGSAIWFGWEEGTYVDLFGKMNTEIGRFAHRLRDEYVQVDRMRRSSMVLASLYTLMTADGGIPTFPRDAARSAKPDYKRQNATCSILLSVCILRELRFLQVQIQDDCKRARDAASAVVEMLQLRRVLADKDGPRLPGDDRDAGNVDPLAADADAEADDLGRKYLDMIEISGFDQNDEKVLVELLSFKPAGNWAWVDSMANAVAKNISFVSKSSFGRKYSHVDAFKAISETKTPEDVDLIFDDWSQSLSVGDTMKALLVAIPNLPIAVKSFQPLMLLTSMLTSRKVVATLAKAKNEHDVDINASSNDDDGNDDDDDDEDSDGDDSVDEEEGEEEEEEDAPPDAVVGSEEGAGQVDGLTATTSLEDWLKTPQEPRSGHVGPGYGGPKQVNMTIEWLMKFAAKLLDGPRGLWPHHAFRILFDDLDDIPVSRKKGTVFVDGRTGKPTQVPAEASQIEESGNASSKAWFATKHTWNSSAIGKRDVLELFGRVQDEDERRALLYKFAIACLIHRELLEQRTGAPNDTLRTWAFLRRQIAILQEMKRAESRSRLSAEEIASIDRPDSELDQSELDARSEKEEEDMVYLFETLRDFVPDAMNTIVDANGARVTTKKRPDGATLGWRWLAQNRFGLSPDEEGVKDLIERLIYDKQAFKKSESNGLLPHLRTLFNGPAGDRIREMYSIIVRTSGKQIFDVIRYMEFLGMLSRESGEESREGEDADGADNGGNGGDDGDDGDDGTEVVTIKTTPSLHNIVSTYNLVVKCVDAVEKNEFVYDPSGSMSLPFQTNTGVGNDCSFKSGQASSIKRAEERKQLLESSRSVLNGHRYYNWMVNEAMRLKNLIGTASAEFSMDKLDNFSGTSIHPINRRERCIPYFEGSDDPQTRVGRAERLRWKWILGSVQSVKSVDLQSLLYGTKKTQSKFKWQQVNSILDQLSNHSKPLIAASRTSNSADDHDDKTVYVRSPSVLSSSVYCETDEYTGSARNLRSRRAAYDKSVIAGTAKKKFSVDGLTRFPYTLGVETVSERLFVSNGFITPEELVDAMKTAMKHKWALKWWSEDFDYDKQVSEFSATELAAIRMGMRTFEAYKHRRSEFVNIAHTSRTTAFASHVTKDRATEKGTAFKMAWQLSRYGTPDDIADPDGMKDIHFGSSFERMRFLHFRDMAVSDLSSSHAFCPYTYDDLSLHVSDLANRLHILCERFTPTAPMTRQQTDSSSDAFSMPKQQTGSLSFLMYQINQRLKRISRTAVYVSSVMLMLIRAKSPVTKDTFDKNFSNAPTVLFWASASLNGQGDGGDGSGGSVADSELTTTLKQLMQQNQNLENVISEMTSQREALQDIFNEFLKLRTEVVFLSECAKKLFDNSTKKTAQRNKKDGTLRPDAVFPNATKLNDVTRPTSAITGVSHVHNVIQLSLGASSMSARKRIATGCMFMIGDTFKDYFFGESRGVLFSASNSRSVLNGQWNNSHIGDNENIDFGLHMLYAEFLKSAVDAARPDTSECFSKWIDNGVVDAMFAGKTNANAVLRLPTFMELLMYFNGEFSRDGEPGQLLSYYSHSLDGTDNEFFPRNGDRTVLRGVPELLKRCNHVIQSRRISGNGHAIDILDQGRLAVPVVQQVLVAFPNTLFHEKHLFDFRFLMEDTSEDIKDTFDSADTTPSIKEQRAITNALRLTNVSFWERWDVNCRRSTPLEETEYLSAVDFLGVEGFTGSFPNPVDTVDNNNDNDDDDDDDGNDRRNYARSSGSGNRDRAAGGGGVARAGSTSGGGNSRRTQTGSLNQYSNFPERTFDVGSYPNVFTASNFESKKTNPDGNCFFHSIIDLKQRRGTLGQNETAATIRAAFAAWLRQLPTLPEALNLYDQINMGIRDEVNAFVQNSYRLPNANYYVPQMHALHGAGFINRLISDSVTLPYVYINAYADYIAMDRVWAGQPELAIAPFVLGAPVLVYRRISRIEGAISVLVTDGGHQFGNAVYQGQSVASYTLLHVAAGSGARAATGKENHYESFVAMLLPMPVMP